MASPENYQLLAIFLCGNIHRKIVAHIRSIDLMTLYDDRKVYPGSKSPYVTERVGGVGGAARQVCTRDVQGGESENGDNGDDDDDNDCGDEDVNCHLCIKDVQGRESENGDDDDGGDDVGNDGDDDDGR